MRCTVQRRRRAGESGLAVGQIRGEQLELVRDLDGAAASEQTEHTDTYDGNDPATSMLLSSGSLLEARQALGLFNEGAIEGEHVQMWVLEWMRGAWARAMWL